MLTVGELIEELSKYPKDTVVYMESDHGQLPEQANFVNPTKAEGFEELPYYGDEIEWNCEDEVPDNDDVRAVLIS